MSSRFLVGLVAWLLGVVTATTGSMIAVNELAHGLLNVQGQQLGGTAVNADFDRAADHARSTPTVTNSPTARASRTPAAKVTPEPTPGTQPSRAESGGSPSGGSPSGGSPSGGSPSGGSPPPPSASPPPTSSGTLLVSADGSVMATCESAGAYLLYWSPDQGFQADDVVRGPAAVASVVFQNTTSSIVMRVSCSNGTPVASVWHDE